MYNMRNKFCIGLISILFLPSCRQMGTQLLVRDLEKNASISQLSDSTFFSDIRSIFYYDDKYYIAEYNRDNILILNNNLDLERSLGNKGRGPGELMGVSHLFVRQDSIFVINDGKRTIEIFDYKGYLATIDAPQEIELSSDIRFCLLANDILLSSPNSNFSMSMFSFNSASIKWFGNLKKYKTQKETKIKNQRHIQVTEDKIIALSDCQPVLELYNIDGELLDVFDFRYIDFIAQLMLYVEKKEISENSYYQIFQDFYISGNQIFVLALSLDENEEVQCNRIIQFEMEDGSFFPKQILSLGHGWFGPICVGDGKILAYNQIETELTLFDYESD
jgi:hypothetical protein